MTFVSAEWKLCQEEEKQMDDRLVMVKMKRLIIPSLCLLSHCFYLIYFSRCIMT